jgi:lipopolysaccharide/colanic/teichoic acid biosynthesis glycosyltransferase
LTTQGKVAAFHRVYSDSAEFAFASADWPHHLFISAGILRRVLTDGVLPLSFSDLSEKCRSEGLALRAINVGGAVLDLDSEDGLLGFCGTRSSKSQRFKLKVKESKTMHGNPRLIGKVLLGSDISIASDAIIVGPTIICDKVTVEPGAIISSSIVGPGVCVPKNQSVQDCIVKRPQHDWRDAAQRQGSDPRGTSSPRNDLSLSRDSHSPFRMWRKFSYARCLKRIADILVAVVVLTLFAPVIPFVALAIRLTSPGPTFYGDRRQGLHGKDFHCLKFRTMITGAHAIQEKLRGVSQVDGPQFKMADDPRISTVGRFLRETYIDEIPQFINVLLGQMSVVGPRPSPESENTLCPLWRDARLSVRPGITGLWQVHRTRQPMMDFQEWIHYDIEYVRNLSLRTDLWICWQTTKKLLDNFISQF